MGPRIVQIDAFADRPFAGNPAAVCLLETYPEDRWMQQVAGEMNLAETAFLRPREEGYDLRWFTPTVEVDLCGHATLASAHFLWQEGLLEREAPARFHTRSGLLSARLRGEWIELDFPADPPRESPAPGWLVDALGVEPAWCGRGRFDWLCELAGEEAVRELEPVMSLLGRNADRGVIATSRAAVGGADFVSRFFAPAVGVDEDPVTGSAHCSLGPYWSDRLGRTKLTAYQASARGGWLEVEVLGERVLLAGQAVTVLEAELKAGPDQ